ncbi:MAG: J domain-containing protein [Thermoplasmatota archaeon]
MLLPMLLLLLTILPEKGECSLSDPIRVDLSLTFDEKDRGHLSFFMGNIGPSKMNETADIPISISPYMNDNMERLLDSFSERGGDNESRFRTLLDCDGDLELENITYLVRAERNYFCLQMEADFRYSTGGIDAEYTFLEIVERAERRIKREPNENILDYNLRRQRELGRIRIRFEVDASSELSLTTDSSVSEHERKLEGEHLVLSANGNEFTSASNKLKVFDHPLLSPAAALISTLLFLLMGLAMLVHIWIRSRFRGIGLLLPLFTLLFSLLLPFGYFSPGFSLYDLGSATIWLFGCAFLILVLLCNFINPRFAFKDFEKEKEEQPTVKMPDVIYVNKHVFVERKVRMSEEEAMDPYEVLEVERGASFQEIERAYKQKVKEYHPDKYTKTPRRIHDAAMKETEKLNIAYEKLKRKHGK